MSGASECSVAVLAGGRSRRLGTDKALVQLADGGPTLLETVTHTARQLASDVFVVATDRPEYHLAGVPIRPDLYPDAGVLGGIASALRHSENDRCLVLSCDHPFLNLELLRALIDVPGYDIVVPAVAGESRQGSGTIRQTLHAVYGRTCLPAIETSLAAGQRQIVRFFDHVRVFDFPESRIREIDPKGQSFFSVNTPEALLEARLIASPVVSPKRPVS